MFCPRFFLPHGLTIDNDGNYWLTDVAMHQVRIISPHEHITWWQRFYYVKVIAFGMTFSLEGYVFVNSVAITKEKKL